MQSIWTMNEVMSLDVKTANWLVAQILIKIIIIWE